MIGMRFYVKREEGGRMKERFLEKMFIYFLCISLLLLTNGFHTMVAKAKEINRPIGEMISKGDVRLNRGGMSGRMWNPLIFRSLKG